MSAIWETATLVKNGVTYWLRDEKARELLKDVADAKVDRAGDTMTGELHIEQASGDTFFRAKRTDTSVQAGMGVGIGGANHGLYSWGYNDGSYHSSGKWMIYRDSSGRVIVNGTATDDLPLGEVISAIPQNSDIDDYYLPGAYRISSNASAATMTNLPNPNAGVLFVRSGVGQAISAPSTYKYLVQEYLTYTGLLYTRVGTSGSGTTVTWGNWYRYITTASLPLSVSNGGTGASSAAGARTNIGAVNIAGDTMSGGLKIEKSGYSFCNVKSNDSKCILEMASASGGSQGLVSSGYYDGSYHADSKWLIYRDTSGRVVVNGHSTDDFNLGLKTSIPSGADLDTYKTVGTYSVSSSSVAASLLHCPTAIAFSMCVEYTLSSTYIKQTVEDYKGENTWARWFNSSWSAWVKTSAPLPLSISDVGCVTEVVTMSQLSLPASGTAHVTKDVSKTGYTPVGIVGITGSNTTGCNIMEFYLSGTTAHIWANNNTATAKTPTYKLTILYFKS